MSNNFIVFSSRFLNQLGMFLFLFLTPIIVLKMTNSPIFAGLTLILEWLPKMSIYLQSYKIFSIFKLKKLIIFFHILQIFGILIYFLSYHYSNVYLFIFSIPIIQFTNAFNNILIEKLIVKLWIKNDWIKAHRLNLNINLIVTLLIFPLSFYLSISNLILFSTICFLLSFILNSIYISIYDIKMIDSISNSNLTFLIKDILKNKNILYLAFLGLIVSTNSIAIVSNMVFYINLIDKDLALNTQLNSFFKSLIGFLAILWLLNLKYIKNSYHIIYINLLVLFFSNLLIYFSNSIYIVVASIISIQLAFYGYNLVSRPLRQSFLSMDNLNYTGLLIGIETFSFLLSGGLFIIFSFNIKLILIIQNIMLISMFLLFYINVIKKKSL